MWAETSNLEPNQASHEPQCRPTIKELARRRAGHDYHVTEGVVAPAIDEFCVGYRLPSAILEHGLNPVHVGAPIYNFDPYKREDFALFPLLFGEFGNRTTADNRR